MARAQRSSSLRRATSWATGAAFSSGCSSNRYSSCPARRETDGAAEGSGSLIGGFCRGSHRVVATPDVRGFLAPDVRVGCLLVVVVVLREQVAKALRVLVDIGPTARLRLLCVRHVGVSTRHAEPGTVKC